MNASLLLVLSAVLAPVDDPGLKPEEIKFKTQDGVIVAADYFAPKAEKGKTAPVAILIHMYPENRKSWKHLVPLLHEAGFAALAYDIRGRGDSVEPASLDLRAKYGTMDPRMFNDAWHDAEAAKTWLTSRPECDTKRLVVIGASVGASIALDYSRREPDVKAIVCLSPGTNYMNINSLAHIRECAAGRPIKIIVPEKEWTFIKPLVEASGNKAQAEQYPGSRAFHGTNLLDCPSADKVKKSIMDFIKPPVGLAAPKKTEDKPKPEDKQKKAP